MRHILTVPACSVAFLAAASCVWAQNGPSSGNKPPSAVVSSQADASGQHERLTSEDFVQLAAAMLLFDIEAAELAVRRAQDPQVQDYAARLLADRRAALQELRRVSQFADLPEDLDADNHRAIEGLEQEHGSEFDANFAVLMADANDDAIDLHEEFLDAMDDESLNAFVNARLETLRAMSEEAHALERSLQPPASGDR
ncbi:MAG: DUF4142 domain-containing protein [Beijerinckiaceae bacterium]